MVQIDHRRPAGDRTAAAGSEASWNGAEHIPPRPCQARIVPRWRIPPKIHRRPLPPPQWRDLSPDARRRWWVLIIVNGSRAGPASEKDLNRRLNHLWRMGVRA